MVKPTKNFLTQIVYKKRILPQYGGSIRFRLKLFSCSSYFDPLFGFRVIASDKFIHLFTHVGITSKEGFINRVSIIPWVFQRHYLTRFLKYRYLRPLMQFLKLSCQICFLNLHQHLLQVRLQQHQYGPTL